MIASCDLWHPCKQNMWRVDRVDLQMESFFEETKTRDFNVILLFGI